jgi:ferric-dicitrate binding protein FerR (iron transport regulator)
LAPASRVRVAADYGRRTGGRDVALEGEAYFAVVHDVAHPFAVRAHGVVARDAGTAFDVRAYPEDAEVRVAVAEGAVVVGDSPLRAGDVARVGADGVDIQHVGNVSRYGAWMQGTLVFEETPLRQVARDIGRAFGVTIVIADSALLEKRITGTLSDRPLDLMLDVVTQTVGARYERTAGKIIIRNGSAGAHERRDGPLPLTTARTGGE